jgi:hypothetical protein
VNKNKIITGLIGLCLLLVLAACSESDSTGQNARERETTAIATGFDRLTRSQQVPSFDFSQERQTLIDLTTIRAHGTHGTAVATALDGSLIWWCPTQGAPIPSTYQLTNPEQIIGRGGHNHYEGQTIPLGEPTGVYTGDSAATWTVCLDDAGTPFARYEEQNVGWTSGVVNGLPADRQAKVDEITYTFTPEDGN